MILLKNKIKGILKWLNILMEVMKKLVLTVFNHERYQTVSIIVASLLLLYFFGCEPKCKSITNPSTTVTRAELDIEIDILIAKANAGYASIESQEELRDLLFQQTIMAAAGGTINPVALLTSIGAILGLGATVDNVRKRKVIRKLES